MIAKIRKLFIHMRFLRRAYDQLQKAAIDATTPERYSAGHYGIQRFTAWRFRRVQKGADLNAELAGLRCDVARMYISAAHPGHAVKKAGAA